MVKKIIKTNPNLIALAHDLRQKSYDEDVAIWKAVAAKLEKSSRSQAEVNVASINRYTSADETVVVPGKVLSNGSLDHKVEVAALKFSEAAKAEIEKAGGECISIADLVEKNPKGSNVKIMQ